MIVITTTKSSVKLEAIKKILNPSSIISYSTENAGLPAQPVNTGLICCHERINFIKSMNDLSNIKYDYIISIENGIDTINHYEKGGDAYHFVDICYIVIEDNLGNRQEYESVAIPIPTKYLEKAQNATSANYKYRNLGYEYTAGSMINKEFPHIDSTNWMNDPKFGGFSRVKQIESAINNVKHIHQQLI